MRSALTAVLRAVCSDLIIIIPARDSAQTKNNKETNAIKIALYFAVFHTDSSARSGCLAPRFWPTSVAAALLKPKAGKIKNTIQRIATVYPATAVLPKPVMILVIAIQLAEPMINCSVAVEA